MSDLLRVVVTLIVIVPLIVGVAYLLKRYMNLAQTNSSGIRILKQLSLNNKERILVIEVEEVKLIVGVSPNAFNTLHILDKNAK